MKLFLNGKGLKVTLEEHKIEATGVVREYLLDDGKEYHLEGITNGISLISDGFCHYNIHASPIGNYAPFGCAGDGMINPSVVNSYYFKDNHGAVGSGVICVGNKRPRVENEEESTKIVTHTLKPDDKRISCVTNTGPSKVVIKDATCFNSDGKTHFCITGSGDVNFQDPAIHLKTCKITITGSGAIEGCTVDKFVCEVTGSGKVGRFTVMKKAKVNLTGSGKIQAKCSPDSKISQHVISIYHILLLICPNCFQHNQSIHQN